MKTRAQLSAREIEELHHVLARRVGDTSVPSLPQVAMKVIELVSDENATIAEFTKTLQSDQALSGRLLRMSNSAYFAQSQPVTRIDRAMVLLGLDKLKALALGFHLSKALLECDDGFSFKRQWTQSLFRAWFAYRLTARVEKKYSGEAFIIGLLCDAGQPLMPTLCGERYYQVVDPSQAPADRFKAEMDNLMFTHTDVAAALCRIWKLPAQLAKPIENHHVRPQFAVHEGTSDQLLQGAAYLAGSLAIDPDLPAEAVKPDPHIAKKLFDITPAELNELIKEVEQDFRASKDVFENVLDPSMRVEDIVERANSCLSEAVEDLVEQVGGLETDTKAEHFEAAGLAFEISKNKSDKIAVVISDSTGNRLLSEQVEPGKQSLDQIRSALMLDDADDDESQPILRAITRLAA